MPDEKLPPDLICPGCGEMRNIESSEDGNFWLCNCCSFTFGKDRPALNENDKALLKRHHRLVDGKPKPWGGS